MRKVKRLVALMFTVVVIFAITVPVKANSTEQGGVGGYTITAVSYVGATGAYGSTSSSTYNPNIIAEVTSATYICIKPYTTDTVTLTGSAWDYSSATKSFTAPSGFRSSSIACSHKATLGAQTWTANTDAML